MKNKIYQNIIFRPKSYVIFYKALLNINVICLLYIFKINWSNINKNIYTVKIYKICRFLKIKFIIKYINVF